MREPNQPDGNEQNARNSRGELRRCIDADASVDQFVDHGTDQQQPANPSESLDNLRAELRYRLGELTPVQLSPEGVTRLLSLLRELAAHSSSSEAT
ncbi:hypothetical protein LF1_18710 [Rubripirellula obstinata]|uniref:Uncharacterized protein n=1 Tax=Rubripirellula obstinata TaxID=406547 RepID=A0A5B1CI30_9BACT|nr:hypothetical protein LF1_18710 [Rubripirellula obstinata]